MVFGNHFAVQLSDDAGDRNAAAVFARDKVEARTAFTNLNQGVARLFRDKLPSRLPLSAYYQQVRGHTEILVLDVTTLSVLAGAPIIETGEARA